MNRILLFAAICGLSIALPLPNGLPPMTLLAGVSKINATLPVGVPLAGYNHGERVNKHYPLPERTEYTYWMAPSTGVMDPTWAKALVLRDEHGASIAWATFDGIGMDGGVAQRALEIAYSKGLKVPQESIIMSASHSHSGPGAVSRSRIWEYAPATDMFNDKLFEMLSSSLADALLEAEKNMKPAKFGVGLGNLTTVTDNRRAGISPYVKRTSIDPNLGLLRVDDAATGEPIATLWNFAIHGTCYGPGNMLASGDIMGKACENIEAKNGGVALFVNADAGDISPDHGACANAPNFAGAATIADAVTVTRAATQTSVNVTFASASKIVEFGKTQMNLTLARLANCTTGLICGLCERIHCDLNLHLGPNWVEESPKFTAFRITVDGVSTLAVTMPGEPLSELGFQVRSDAAQLGFHQTLLCGYSNNHLGYATTEDEYDIGGYESELSFWGTLTGVKFRDGANQVMRLV